jgi:hypothetical protein
MHDHAVETLQAATLECGCTRVRSPAERRLGDRLVRRNQRDALGVPLEQV